METEVNVKTTTEKPRPAAASGRRPSVINPDTRKITKRLVMALIGCAMVYYFLSTHRNWVWAYFASLMLMKDPDPALAAVAGQSISAITTIAVTGITAISAIVVWFITGNVMAMASMFKFSSLGTASASVTSDSISEHRDERVNIKEERIERVFVEGEPGAPERRPFSMTGEE